MIPNSIESCQQIESPNRCPNITLKCNDINYCDTVDVDQLLVKLFYRSNPLRYLNQNLIHFSALLEPLRSRAEEWDIRVLEPPKSLADEMTIHNTFL